jgi:hypothetical protein
MPLSDTAIRNAKPESKPYKLRDTGNLYITIAPSGGKLWRMDYRHEGKRKTLAFGSYPAIGLADARQRRDEARKLLASGTDPGEVRKAQKAAKLKPVEVADTFQQVAADWREVWATHVTQTTAKEIWANLTTYVFPRIGALPIEEVSTKVLIDCLRQIEETGRGATLRKSKGAISLIFKFAIQNERGVTQNPVLNFDRHTFRKFKVHNFPTLLDPLEIGKLLRAIDAYHGTLPSVSAALRLAPMLFQRIGELRTMRWADVDLDNPDGAE